MNIFTRPRKNDCGDCDCEKAAPRMSVEERSYYANKLASALCGRAQLAFSDASKLQKCNSLADGDEELVRAFMQSVRAHDPEVFRLMGRYICTVDGSPPDYAAVK